MEKFQRVLVIGDIHAQIQKLMSLHEKLKVTDKDLVIYLGDYVDRGYLGITPNVDVLKFMIKESEKDNVILCCGNHEQFMLEFFYNEDYNWLMNGGLQTLKEIQNWYKEDDKASDNIIKLIGKLRLHYEMEIKGQKYFFVHAGVDPRVPLQKQDKTDLLFIRERFFVPYDGEAVIVSAHTPLIYVKSEAEIEEQCQKLGIEISSKNEKEALADGDITVYRTPDEAKKIENIKPQWRRNGKILMMDTGSFMPNGCISCVDILSNEVWQSD